jgi:DNA gyrase subunit A
MRASNLVGMDDEVEAIAKGARLKMGSAQERVRILTAVLRGVDRYDDLIAIMRSSESADEGRRRVAELMNLDHMQANAISGITLNMLTERHRRLMAEDYDRSLATIADLEAVLASPERLRELVGTERGASLARYGEE